jgi:hypothetical protein
MSEDGGKDFWGRDSAFDELKTRAASQDSFERWAAAFELGELGDARAVEGLRALLSDPDEYVRQVAETALTKLASSLGTLPALAMGRDGLVRMQPLRSFSDAPPYIAWKIKPLPAPARDNAWVVEAALAEIVEVEGPILGKRLFKLYSAGVEMQTGKRGNHPVHLSAALCRLIDRGRVVRSDDFASPRAEHWIVHRIGTSPVLARQRGRRELDEIPVNEAREVLRALAAIEPGRKMDRERIFQLLILFYQADRELHKIGGLLAENWASLLAVNP